MIKQLRTTSDDAVLYTLTDYHWLLIYEALEVYCSIHNDLVREVSDALYPVGPYRIGQIDFAVLVDSYFLAIWIDL